MARISEIVSAACPRVLQVGLELVQLLVELGSGEPVAERVEDVVGGLAASCEPGELTAEHGGVEQRRHDRSDGGEREPAHRRWRAPAASTTPVRNPIEDRCPSPIARTLITNRRLPAGVAGLVGMGARCWGCTAPHPRWRTRW